MNICSLQDLMQRKEVSNDFHIPVSNREESKRHALLSLFCFKRLKTFEQCFTVYSKRIKILSTIW